MALRVLLADESSTIKKVIQLALQDFGVQVKSVNLGIDALQVAKEFRPDIIFADVLLQKKSGYDVCGEIKKDEELANIPVVLMWSGFLELDEDQFRSSAADDQLEKPFNVDSLRALIKKWVPKIGGQQLTDFIEFPASVRSMQVPAQDAEPLPPVAAAAPSSPPEPPAPTSTAPKHDWSMDDFADIQEYVDHEADSPVITQVTAAPPASAALSALPASAAPSPSPASPSGDGDGDEVWLTRDLSRFKLDVPEEDEMQPLELPKLDAGETTLIANHSPRVSAPTPPPPPAPASPARSSPVSPLSAEELEKIVRDQSREIIEAVVRRVVPELAGSLIRQELDRLLKEEMG